MMSGRLPKAPPSLQSSCQELHCIMQAFIVEDNKWRGARAKKQEQHHYKGINAASPPPQQPACIEVGTIACGCQCAVPHLTQSWAASGQLQRPHQTPEPCAPLTAFERTCLQNEVRRIHLLGQADGQPVSNLAMRVHIPDLQHVQRSRVRVGLTYASIVESTR